ncbi:MAG: BatA domain-containing protein, partial [Planctomycetes bacterium]|nr:BatA domain-containing protein [Planctomycetota bacterium]
MTFGAAHWLWLLLLAAPLVVLYTRRPRRPVVRVPALHLWTVVAGPARAPGRRLLGRLDDRLLALLLFLLALAGIVLGLARPGEAPGEARAAVFVVDVGAAMAVRDGAPRRPRLERAREALARLEADLGPQGRRWVVAAGATPQVVAGPDDALPPGAPQFIQYHPTGLPFTGILI